MNSHIVFDLTSRKDLIRSLNNYFNIQTEHIEAFARDPRASLEFFLKAFSITDKQVRKPDLLLASFHSTTNSDHCASVQQHGLLNLQQAIRQDTPLSRYLRDHGIIIDIDKKQLDHNGTIYNIDKDYKGVKQGENLARDIVAFKLYEDCQINGFLCTDDVLDYGGDVHLRPEFLLNLAVLLNDSTIESDWQKDPEKRNYVLKFVAPISDYHHSSFFSNGAILAEKTPETIELMTRYKLLDIALKNLHFSVARGYVHEEISYLNLDTVVPPENIINIYTAKQYSDNKSCYCETNGTQ
jgi:hypothetical protein